MRAATCGCPMDEEFVYHQKYKCSLRLSISNRIGISVPDCLSCAALREEVKAGAHLVATVGDKNRGLESRLALLEKVAPFMQIYFHAHETGNSVPPNIVEQARAALAALKETK